MSPIISPSGGGGGGSQPFSATFSTDPNTFIGQHIFDFGGQCVVKAKMVATAFVGNGETFGVASGNIFMDSAYSAGVGALGISESIDGVRWKVISPIPFLGSVYSAPGPNSSQDIYDLNTDNYINTLPCQRYLAVMVALEDADSGNIYAGANHPVLTVRVSGTYL